MPNVFGCLVRERLGRRLEQGQRGIEDLGDWYANVNFKSTFIRRMLDEHPDKAVVWLDADSIVWEYPALFDTLDAEV